MVGINNIVSKKILIIPKKATIPNSTKILLSVIINVANPNAVVEFVKNVAFPTLLITRCKAFILLLCKAYSWWYLLRKYTLLGTLITIISGGNNAVKIVKS